ncbi:MAG TPA: hypothetical protein VED67_04780 [Thermodesulfovibrionales bacterium]|nr:hypothetical protein [Thermodesulfovibrionales bacterium]
MFKEIRVAAQGNGKGQAGLRRAFAAVLPGKVFINLQRVHHNITMVSAGTGENGQDAFALCIFIKFSIERSYVLSYSGEKKSRQFAVSPLVVEAFAALMLTCAALVCAGAIFLVDFHDAFHADTSSQMIFAAVFSVAQKGRKRE